MPVHFGPPEAEIRKKQTNCFQQQPRREVARTLIVNAATSGDVVDDRARHNSAHADRFERPVLRYQSIGGMEHESAGHRLQPGSVVGAGASGIAQPERLRINVAWWNLIILFGTFG